jgi:hypothetical protein
LAPLEFAQNVDLACMLSPNFGRAVVTLRTVVLLKVAVASAAVVTLIAIPARELVPNITLAELVLYIACAFVALVVVAVCSLQIAQFILRTGGTDPQWFWFKADPPGLEQQRREAKEGSRES